MFTTTVEIPLYLFILWSIPACGAILWLFVQFFLGLFDALGRMK